MGAHAHLRDAVGRWRDEIGDTHALGAARVVLGLLLLETSLRAVNELRAGYFGDVFHWPIVPEALVPSKAVYAALLVAEVVASTLVVIGLGARTALFVSAIANTYVLLCDRLQFHHNRWALACYALLFALSPCDRCYALAARQTLSIGPGGRASTAGPLWAARLAQVQVSIVYLASGASKLLDPDWRAGRVLATRVALYGRNALDAGVPPRIVTALSDPAIAGTLAKLAIATELLLSVGLWARRTRPVALWWGVWFHLTIEVTSRVESFTWLTLAMYALFATPDVGGRAVVYDPSRSSERIAARAVAGLDWLARFRLEPSVATRSVGGAPSGSLVEPQANARGLVVIDRNGRRARGIGAFAAWARGTPVVFPLWLPLSALAVVVCYVCSVCAPRGRSRVRNSRGGGGGPCVP